MGKILIFCILACLCCASCNTSGCTDNKSSIPLAGFYSYSDLKSISIKNVSIGGVGAPNDSLLLDKGSESKIYLPFRPSQDVTSFFFHYHDLEVEDDPFDDLNDTITFSYTRLPYFESEECGAMFRYIVKEFSYTRHLIDSVSLVDSVITNADIESIKIYFHTSTKQ